MSYAVNRVVVIGSGTMGGGIAAHVANAGIPVYLLDIAPQGSTTEEEKRGLNTDHPQVRNRIATASLERLKKSKPAAFFTPDVADLVTVGNLEDNFEWVGEGDLVVEAIVENLAVKRELIARIEKVRKPNSIVSSNTSGLPIIAIAAQTSADFKAHFLGTHFFNPPRYMRELGMDHERTNVNGGAVALGHPLGASGAKLTVQLLGEMRRRRSRYGMVTMCVGGGQGAATIFENLQN